MKIWNEFNKTINTDMALNFINYYLLVYSTYFTIC